MISLLVIVYLPCPGFSGLWFLAQTKQPFNCVTSLGDERKSVYCSNYQEALVIISFIKACILVMGTSSPISIRIKHFKYCLEAWPHCPNHHLKNLYGSNNPKWKWNSGPQPQINLWPLLQSRSAVFFFKKGNGTCKICKEVWYSILPHEPCLNNQLVRGVLSTMQCSPHDQNMYWQFKPVLLS